MALRNVCAHSSTGSGRRSSTSASPRAPRVAGLRFDPDIARAVEGCAFIQENGPERVNVKRDLLARISAVAPSDSLIATSSSGILISDIQDAAAHPERVLLGHPFNPRI
jgi:carnitine 3-dehydrogenase